jgi:hypothetical protein
LPIRSRREFPKAVLINLPIIPFLKSV